MCKAAYGSKLSVLHAVLTVAAAVTILILSVMPPLTLFSGTAVNSGIPLHMIAYGTLCFLTCMWFRVGGITQAPYLCAFFLCSLYGLLVECVQFGVPYRSFETGDILTNCLAAALAILPSYAMMRYVPLYKKQPGCRKLFLN